MPADGTPPMQMRGWEVEFREQRAGIDEGWRKLSEESSRLKKEFTRREATLRQLELDLAKRGEEELHWQQQARRELADKLRETPQRWSMETLKGVAEREKEVERREREVERREQALQGSNALREVEAQRRELERWESSLRELEQRLKEKEEALAARSEELAVHEREISHKTEGRVAELKHQQETTQRAAARHAEKEAEVQELRKMVEEKEAAVERAFLALERDRREFEKHRLDVLHELGEQRREVEVWHREASDMQKRAESLKAEAEVFKVGAEESERCYQEQADALHQQLQRVRKKEEMLDAQLQAIQSECEQQAAGMQRLKEELVDHKVLQGHDEGLRRLTQKLAEVEESQARAAARDRMVKHKEQRLRELVTAIRGTLEDAGMAVPGLAELLDLEDADVVGKLSTSEVDILARSPGEGPTPGRETGVETRLDFSAATEHRLFLGPPPHPTSLSFDDDDLEECHHPDPRVQRLLREEVRQSQKRISSLAAKQGVPLRSITPNIM